MKKIRDMIRDRARILGLIFLWARPWEVGGQNNDVITTTAWTKQPN